MRQSLEDFVRKINRKKFDEELWYEIDYFTPSIIIQMLKERYQIVFDQKWELNYTDRKIEIWDYGIEELYSFKPNRKLLCSSREEICSYLEKIYLYIIKR